MKLVRTAALALCGVMGIVPMCSAAPIDSFQISDSNILTITGTPEGTAQYDPIRIEIIRPGKSVADIADLDKETLLDTFLWYEQVPANEQGGYTLTADMNGEKAGYYTVRINGSDVRQIYYEDYTARSEFAASLLDMTAEEIEAALDLENEGSQAVAMLGLQRQEIFDADPSALSETIVAALDTYTGESISVAEVVDFIDVAAILTCLSEGKVGIADYIEYFGMDEAYTQAYHETLSDAQRELVGERFLNNSLATAEAAKAYFAESVVVSMVQAPASWSNIKYVIENFYEDTGINISRYNNLSTGNKEKVYTNFAEDSYADLSEFGNAVNSYMNSLSNSSGGSGGGGGGGGRPSSGGSSSGGGSNTVVSGGGTTTPVAPVTPDGEEEASSFSDLENVAWAQEAINALAADGIISGVGDGRFEPERSITREEFVAMLVKAFDIPSSDTAAGFTDAAADGWYASYLAAAKQAGLVNGYEDGSFGVGQEITREDVTVFLYRAQNLDSTKTEESELFADDADISAYAADAVYALRDQGIISGRGNNEFAPKAPCTRAEAAKMIYSLVG